MLTMIIILVGKIWRKKLKDLIIHLHSRKSTMCTEDIPGEKCFIVWSPKPNDMCVMSSAVLNAYLLFSYEIVTRSLMITITDPGRVGRRAELGPGPVTRRRGGAAPGRGGSRPRPRPASGTAPGRPPRPGRGWPRPGPGATPVTGPAVPLCLKILK